MGYDAPDGRTNASVVQPAPKPKAKPVAKPATGKEKD